MRLQSFNITGDGSAHTIAALTGGAITMCKWFQLRCNSGTMTVGGAEADATHGMPVDAGGGNQFLPPLSQSQEFYDLQKVYAFLSNTDTGVLLCAL